MSRRRMTRRGSRTGWNTHSRCRPG
jgi:hypothetical protein